jgi:hypothetical protein
MHDWRLRHRDRLNAADRERSRDPGRRAAKKVADDAKRALHQARVNTIKVERGCIDCGYSVEAVALQFDHVRGVKVKAIGTLIRDRAPWARIVEEIAKCEVRCANCHFIKTWRP